MDARTLKICGAMLLCLVVIAVDLAYYQALRAPSLAADPRNARGLLASYARYRAPILSAEGTILAVSEPSGDELVYRRSYPRGELFAHVTGFLSFTRGATGLERSYQRAMLGDDWSLALRPQGFRRALMGRKPAASPVLTISEKAQSAAARALGSRVGAVVALDPRTGAVLAMYSQPTYDPNQISSHDENVAAPAYSRATDPKMGKPMLSRAFGERRPPGSTFKLVVAAAALEAGVPPNQTFPDPPLLDLPGTDNKLANFRRGSPCESGTTITLHRALVLSCNTTFAQLGLALGDEALRRQAKRFGFGSGFPSLDLETAPSVFPESKAFQGNDAAKAFAAIGQFDVQATPLQMAVVAAAIGNSGIVKAPFVVGKLTGEDGTVVLDRTASGGETLGQALDTANAAVLKDMMVDAVERGTGRAARIPRVKVAGKTGTTSEFEQAWFVGFAPADDPKVAVAVLVENEGREATGGEVAAPIAREVMLALL